MVRKLPTVLTLIEFNQLLKKVKKRNHRIAFKLGFYCGLRISEVIKLKPTDVDYGRQMLFLSQAKGSKDAYVPFPPKLGWELKRYLPVNITSRGLQKAIKKYAIKAKIEKDITFHTLRHSCATYWLEQGKDIRVIQNLLRHSKIETTTIYTHVSPELVKKEMNELWK